ncbi:expressed unknown protein [Seminavis robusta]|uniref:Uncharacterized protein n=1 Tax=Seminavis robusta TaxID=568900 RepID=A0A9N8HD24_9STRA|nr:expressed unknown protein [Seminavis robusta]|eukprot:Sro325_g117890.1 n/a (275) ;mRNA; f:63333-64157
MKSQILALLLCLFLQQVASEHLPRTKGVRGAEKRALQGKEDKGKGKDGKGKKGVLGVTEETDRAETTYATGEDGNALYIPVDVDGFEGRDYFDFEDTEDAMFQRQDQADNSTVIDVAPAVQEGETAIDAAPEIEVEELEDIDVAPVVEEEAEEEVKPDKKGDSNDEEEVEEEEEAVEEVEEELVEEVEDVPQASSQVNLRILELELQVDSLMQLNETVAELQAQMSSALHTINTHEMLISSLAALINPADYSVSAQLTPPPHISIVRNKENPTP